VSGGRAGPRGGAASFAAALVLGLAACAPAHDAESLFTRLRSNDVEVRQDAAEELEAVLKQGDYKVFERGLKSPNRMHQIESITYLARMPQPEARAALRDLLRVGRRTMLPYNPIRLKPQSEETDSRILVAHLIEESGGDPEAAGAIIEGVGEGQPQDVLTGACFALGALRDPKGIPFLVTSSRSRDVEVARAAIQALGQFHDRPEVLEALRAASSHPELVVREDVLSSLDLQGGPGAAELLREISVKDPSATIRATAIERLPRFKDPSLVPFLIDQLKRREEPAASTTLRTLVQLTGQNLGSDPEKWSRWWARSGRQQWATR
jgi:HEAT repeat protein